MVKTKQCKEKIHASKNILNLPLHGNMKLKALLELIDHDLKIQTFWKCANVTAIDRMGYTDHGPIHVKIVANSALEMLRILVRNGIVPNVVTNYGFTVEDAEVIVVLGSIFHDLGMVVTRKNHEEYSIFLALSFLEQYLKEIYDVASATIITAEVLHTLATHHHDREPLTIEAGIVRIADSLDMAQGRARIPFKAGKIDIHSVSALSITQVKIEKGTDKPIIIKIYMNSSAGIFQVDQLLRTRINHSGLEQYVRVVAVVKETKESRVIDRFEL